MTRKRNSKAERLNEIVSYRISASARARIEKYAEENEIGLCEAARVLLNVGIQARCDE
jgi:hypothetical protein